MVFIVLFLNGCGDDENSYNAEGLKLQDTPFTDEEAYVPSPSPDEKEPNLSEEPYHNTSQCLWEAVNGYNYRIPGIVAMSDGTLIAYCEERKGVSDWAHINIVQRTSKDGGKSWTASKKIVDGVNAKHTINNPVMIADGERLHLLYEIEYGLTSKGGGIYYQYSDDLGETWSDSTQILTSEASFNVFATGPGHGVISKSGILIVPVWLVLKAENVEETSHHPGSVSTIFSIDNGQTWNLGGIVPKGAVTDTSESSIVELPDDSFYINIRNQSKAKRRAFSFSKTGFSDWFTMNLDTQLADPICFGSLAKYDDTKILFVNCNNEKSRENLTLRISENDCHTWSTSYLLRNSGGYADIAVNKDKIIFNLYEQQYIHDGITEYQIFVESFNLLWLNSNRRES